MLKSKKPKGVCCPNCAVPMRVRSTRHRTAGLTIRVRECGTCGQRVKTFERAAITTPSAHTSGHM